MVRYIFFDFFGTLVSYSPSRRDQGYEISHRILQSAGGPPQYEEFLDLWCEIAEAFDAKYSDTHQEYSMIELGSAFLERALGSTPSPQLTSRFVDAYLMEWNKGVRYLPGLADFLARLSKQYTFGLITNTSDSELIREHLQRIGIHDLFRVLVTSVEYGFRKPHVGIFQHAMSAAGARPEESVFVGDSFEADYCGGNAAGMRSFLIDPDRRAAIPDALRLENLFDLEPKLTTENEIRRY